MKNSITLAGRILLSALFFVAVQGAVAQSITKNDASANSISSENWQDEDVYINKLSEDGIPDGVIKTLVAKRRQNIIEQRKIVPAKEEPLKLFGQNPSVQALCSDMGGETGWGGWTARSGSYNSCSPVSCFVRLLKKSQ